MIVNHPPFTRRRSPDAQVSGRSSRRTGIFDRHSVPNEDAVLNGIAYDPQSKRLFVTGKLWPKLFEVRVVAK